MNLTSMYTLLFLLFSVVSTAAFSQVSVNLQSRSGIARGEPYPLGNQSEAGGFSFNTLSSVSFELGSIATGGVVLPISYVFLDLPGGAAVQNWLVNNISLYGKRELKLSADNGIQFGFGMSFPTGNGGSTPDKELELAKSQAVSSALSGNSSRELYEPGRTGIIPFLNFDSKLGSSISMRAFGKAPIMMLIGGSSDTDHNIDRVNTLAVNTVVGFSGLYQLWQGIHLGLNGRYSRFLRDVVETKDEVDRSGVVLEPTFELQISSWVIQLGYTRSLFDSNNREMQSGYLQINWGIGGKPSNWMPIF